MSCPADGSQIYQVITKYCHSKVRKNLNTNQSVLRGKTANNVHKPSKRVGSHQSVVGWVLWWVCGGSVHTLEATEAHWGVSKRNKNTDGAVSFDGAVD